MKNYKGYLWGYYHDRDTRAAGHWFVIVRPDGSRLSNTLFYCPGILFHSAAMTRRGAERQVRRAIRRDRRGW